jgi:hypothetical protein
MLTNKKAEEIVKLILKNLKGRSGIGDILESIEYDDEETYEEIINSLVEIIIENDN